jgi:hypothetical protein|tara:strand:+ start:254 stop:439 length:186 start_codon:yes stop_codon:yes gene_type:complete
MVDLNYFVRLHNDLRLLLQQNLPDYFLLANLMALLSLLFLVLVQRVSNPLHPLNLEEMKLH